MTVLDKKTIYLKDYTPYPFIIDNTELTFRLHPEKTRVISKLTVRPNPAYHGKGVFELNGEEITLIWARINGAEITPKVSKTHLNCPVPDGAFIFECEVELAPAQNTSLIGLYMSNGMYCTQCEPEGFRKITYFPDRPDVLSVYDVSIESDLPVLLSNGNPVATDDGPARWHDPWPKPSYLFALVAGDLSVIEDQFVTKFGKEVALKLVIRPQDEHKTDFAMQALKKSMKWDEERYGREYDLDVFHIVAVDDFNFGAMENKGLNIFNSAVVLANPDTTTDASFESIEAIIAHEYFHNWTGNRITCRDWFQLCLKEGLTVYRDAQFTSDMRSAAVKRVEDAILMRTQQFAEDAGPLSHAVRPESFVDIENFYTRTIYEKGAELVGMLRTIVGDQAFYKALDLYFDRHDGQAVTIEDWIKVFEDSTGHNLEQFMLWYRQAGTPQINYALEHDDNGLVHLELRQSMRDENAPALHIPIAVALLDPKGDEIMPTTVLELTQAQQRFDLGTAAQKPVLSILRDFSAPVAITTTRSAQELGFLMAHDGNPYCRWDASNALGLMVITQSSEKTLQETLIQGFAAVIENPDLDPAFKSKLLRLPSDGEIVRYQYGRGITPDPEALYQSRKSLMEEISATLLDPFKTLHRSMQINEPYQPNAEQSGKRALASAALSYITRQDGGALAKEVFESAQNFTDYLMSFAELCRTDHGQGAKDQFWAKWQSDHLVLDRFYMVWAASAEPDQTIRVLNDAYAHSRNAEAQGGKSTLSPNRFRALYGPLMGKPAALHAQDGSGYDKIKEAVLEIESKNHHLSARLCSALQDIQMFDDGRQAKATNVIEALLEQSSLSARTREILGRIISA